MNVHDQRLQLGLEGDVIVRAAQAALAAELVKRDPADRTGLLVEAGPAPRPSARWPFAGTCWAKAAAMPAAPAGSPEEEVRYCRGVVLAEVQFLRLAAGQFRDVERRRTCRTVGISWRLHSLSSNLPSTDRILTHGGMASQPTTVAGRPRRLERRCNMPAALVSC